MAAGNVKVMSMPSPSLFRRGLVSAVAISSALLLLAGCSGGSIDTILGNPIGGDTGAGQEQASGQRPVDLASKGTVIVQLEEQSFTFIATTCMQSTDDFLVSGPGIDNESREIAYFDLDFTNMSGSSTFGGARIDLGTDKPMTSTDKFYVVDVGTSDEYSIMNEQKGVTVEGVFRTGNGEQLGLGSIVISCDS